MHRLTLRKLLIEELSWKRLVRSLLFIYAFFAIYVYFRGDRHQQALQSFQKLVETH